MIPAYSNLPIDDQLKKNDSSVDSKRFFENYNKYEFQFQASESDATVAFFTQRGMEESAARSVAFIFLKQCKLDDVNPFELLSKLKKLEGQGNTLDNVVGEILNINRIKTSALGSKVEPAVTNPAKRNIVA